MWSAQLLKHFKWLHFVPAQGLVDNLRGRVNYTFMEQAFCLMCVIHFAFHACVWSYCYCWCAHLVVTAVEQLQQGRKS